VSACRRRRFPSSTRPRRPGRAAAGRPGPRPSQGAAAVLFQAELALERLEDALDPLPEAAQRAVPAWLISAVGSQQPGAVGGDQLLEVAAGQALIGQDDQARTQPAALMVQHGRHDFALAQPRVPGTRPPAARPRRPAHIAGSPRRSGGGSCSSRSRHGQPAPTGGPSGGWPGTAPESSRPVAAGHPAWGVSSEVLDRQRDQRRGPAQPPVGSRGGWQIREQLAIRWLAKPSQRRSEPNPSRT
jgi:hypothetical protein